MTDPHLYVTVALAALAGVAMLTVAALSGWRGWLELRRDELEQRMHAPAPVGARIEIADLRERIRKLEAIAAGVDL